MVSKAHYEVQKVKKHDAQDIDDPRGLQNACHIGTS